MSNPVRWAMRMAAVAAALASSPNVSATQALPGLAVPELNVPDPRVRGLTPRVVGLLREATARSQTFHHLVATIDGTDGVVYVGEGRCGQGLRACLLHTVTIAGPRRVLRVLVDPRHPDTELMRSLGHELQHAVEVLSDRTVRSNAALRLLYTKQCSLCRDVFETDAAVRAGDAVRAELEEQKVVRPQDPTAGCKIPTDD